MKEGRKKENTPNMASSTSFHAKSFGMSLTFISGGGEGREGRREGWSLTFIKCEISKTSISER